MLKYFISLIVLISFSAQAKEELFIYDWSDYIARLINAGSIIPPEGTAKEDFIKERIKIRSSIKDEEVLEAETNIATFLLSTNRLEDGGLVTISTDITDFKRINNAVSLLSDAMNKSNNGIMITDHRDKIVFANSFVKERMQKAGISFTEQIQYSDHIRRFIDAGIVKPPENMSAEEFITDRIKERDNIKDQNSRELDTEMGARIQTTTRLDDGGLVISFNKVANYAGLGLRPGF